MRFLLLSLSCLFMRYTFSNLILHNRTAVQYVLAVVCIVFITVTFVLFAPFKIRDKLTNELSSLNSVLMNAELFYGELSVGQLAWRQWTRVWERNGRFNAVSAETNI